MNQRVHPRYPISLDCRLSHRGQHVMGRSKDLSRGGIAIQIDRPIEIGATIDLAVSLVFGDNLFSEPLEVRALVVWCTPFSGGHQLGAKFLDVVDKKAEYLDVFLKFLSGELEVR